MFSSRWRWRHWLFGGLGHWIWRRPWVGGCVRPPVIPVPVFFLGSKLTWRFSEAMPFRFWERSALPPHRRTFPSMLSTATTFPHTIPFFVLYRLFTPFRFLCHHLVVCFLFLYLHLFLVPYTRL